MLLSLKQNVGGHFFKMDLNQILNRLKAVEQITDEEYSLWS